MINNVSDYINTNRNSIIKSYSKNDLAILMSDDMPESVKIEILKHHEEARKAKQAKETTNSTTVENVTHATNNSQQNKLKIVHRSKHRQS
jgi:hypothetical protein